MDITKVKCSSPEAECGLIYQFFSIDISVSKNVSCEF